MFRSRPIAGAALLLLALSSMPGAASGAAQALPSKSGTSSSHVRETQADRFPNRSRYLDAIRKEALAHGIAADLVDAVVRVESGYNPEAIGGVGEIGLMQVRPTTAALLGFKGTDAELAEPHTNLRYGVAYLAKAWRLARGDLCRALMKYRAGHGAEFMTPLSVEYCRRARVHLAALGWSAPSRDGPAHAENRHAHALKQKGGPRMISVRSADAVLAANRARIADIRSRISVLRRR